MNDQRHPTLSFQPELRIGGAGAAIIAKRQSGLRAVAFLSGSLIVLGIGVVIGAGVAQSLPLSVLVSGKLATIAPELAATNGITSP
jgi:hypothetical protein